MVVLAYGISFDSIDETIEACSSSIRRSYLEFTEQVVIIFRKEDIHNPIYED